MTDLQIYLAMIAKVSKSLLPVLVYIIVGLAVLGRREKLEKERLAKIIERDKLKRINNKKCIVSRD